MIKADTIAGIISIILSITFFLSSLGFKSGTSDGVPGPGYFPIILSAMMGFIGVCLIIQGIRFKKRYFIIDDKIKKNLKSFFLTILAIGVYLVLWNIVPFIIRTPIFLFSLNFIYKRELKYNILFSGITSASIYLIFNNLFHVML